MLEQNQKIMVAVAGLVILLIILYYMTTSGGNSTPPVKPPPVDPIIPVIPDDDNIPVVPDDTPVVPDIPSTPDDQSTWQDMSNPDIIPDCYGSHKPIFRNNKWQCDYYTLDASVYPGAPHYWKGAPYTGDGTETCTSFGPNCLWTYVMGDGTLKYSDASSTRPGFVTGFRLSPLDKGIYKRFNNMDNSGSFYAPLPAMKLWSLPECENYATANNAYAYVSGNGYCTPYNILPGDTNKSWASRFLRDSY